MAIFNQTLGVILVRVVGERSVRCVVGRDDNKLAAKQVMGNEIEIEYSKGQ